MRLPPLLHAADNMLLRRVFSPRIEVRPRRSIVSFTFDDIPSSAASLGARILEDRGARGTFYIAGGLISRADSGFANVPDLRRLSESGHELGCHTFCHRGLRALSASDAAADLEANARFFNDALGLERPSNFAYPFNKGTLSGLGSLRARYRSARGGRCGINRGATPAYQLSAVEIAQPEANQLDGWLDGAVENPGWLIYFTHDVSENPGPYGSRPETLDRLVAGALERGHEVLTVDAALDRLGVGS